MPLPPLSVLDLAPIVEGSTPGEALRNSLDLAQHAERWGYRRFWLAEHHNVIGIASAATAVVIAHVAGGTKTIRVGAGGIMLPNHAPIVIAEQFGTLESLYPGPDRSRPRPRARHRPAHDARAAPRARRAPTRSRRTCSSCSATSPTPSPARLVQAMPGAGLARAALDPRLEPVRRAARRAARPAVRVRVALRAGGAAAGARRSTARRSSRPSSCRSRTRWSART